MVAVYPHVCGGIARSLIGASCLRGLSPRVWGHRKEVWEQIKDKRSIPTCVGASGHRGLRRAGRRVYPHVCGGIFSGCHPSSMRIGLSPRVWGHPKHVRSSPLQARSIPTCVGASSERSTSAPTTWVYPHVCGGILSADGQARQSEGLSPRVWGHLVRVVVGGRSRRSIPTCVGASSYLKCLIEEASVYPHVCGGIRRMAKAILKNDGLSPRVWGHHLNHLLSTHDGRSIPTCVGASFWEAHCTA